MLGKTLRLGECVKVKVIIGWIVFICGAVMAGVGGVLATKSEWALVDCILLGGGRSHVAG